MNTVSTLTRADRRINNPSPNALFVRTMILGPCGPCFFISMNKGNCSETKALKIFAENINQIVEREKLMKEIWEDEGIVVISRNVDVLVSKLRKKLSDDNSIKFINVHGRGYKFITQ